ncbi:MAG: hypothetical protein JRF63_07600 [Deltaproteobacteria bacterium]|nr:hypothetical protein [Deltaproteobacteria bacterium]
MRANRKLYGAIPLVALAAALILTSSCGGMSLDALGGGSGSGSGAGLTNVAEAAANCPNLASASAVANVNFANEFGLKAKDAAKIEAALIASAEIKNISRQIEAELKTACGKLARDLGAQVKGNSAKAACKAAADAISQLKAKAKGKLVLDVTPPKCSASIDAMADCAAKCDVNIKPGKVDVQCKKGELSGKCDAQCQGSCTVQAGAKCEGTCHGECTADFAGRCGGKCDGQCDGQSTGGKASCDGKCEGKCHASGKGQCKGSCKGECKLKASAECKGECTGDCSVKMKAPKCTGEIEPPKMSAECKAKCEAKVSAKVKCTPAQVRVKIKGAADAKAAKKLVVALRANLPAILKVAIGMRGKLVRLSGNIKAVIRGVQGSLDAMAQGSAQAGARLAACVAAPFKAAIDASAKIKVNVEVSAEVHASAKGSASGSTGGSGRGIGQRLLYCRESHAISRGSDGNRRRPREVSLPPQVHQASGAR